MNTHCQFQYPDGSYCYSAGGCIHGHLSERPRLCIECLLPFGLRRMDGSIVEQIGKATCKQCSWELKQPTCIGDYRVYAHQFGREIAERKCQSFDEALKAAVELGRKYPDLSIDMTDYNRCDLNEDGGFDNGLSEEQSDLVWEAVSEAQSEGAQ